MPLLQFRNKLFKQGMLIILLCCFLILSGCDGVFSNNPVVQFMKDGNNKIDLTMEDVNSLLDEYSNASDPEPSATETSPEKALFDEFVARVQHADFIQYEQTISYPEESTVEAKSQQQEFLGSGALKIIEKRNDFVITNSELTRKVLHDNSGTFLLDLEALTSTNYSLQQKDTKDLLYDICSKDLTLLSVDKETIGESEYDSYSVNEGAFVSKWYFDDNSNIFLRIYKENNVIQAVKYDYLDFAPEIDANLFVMSDALNADDGIEDDLAETSSTDASSTPSSASSSSSKPIISSTVPSSSSPSSQSSYPSSPASSPPPASSLPESSQPPPPSSIPDLSSGKTTSSAPPEAENPKIPDNYPHRQVPIVGGFTPTYSKEETGVYRIIELNGNVSGSFAGTSNFYLDVFSGSENFSSKEMYDDKTGNTYFILQGKVNGWQTKVEIAESHTTSKTTVSIRLKR